MDLILRKRHELIMYAINVVYTSLGKSVCQMQNSKNYCFGYVLLPLTMNKTRKNHNYNRTLVCTFHTSNCFACMFMTLSEKKSQNIRGKNHIGYPVFISVQWTYLETRMYLIVWLLDFVHIIIHIKRPLVIYGLLKQHLWFFIDRRQKAVRIRLMLVHQIHTGSKIQIRIKNKKT